MWRRKRLSPVWCMCVCGTNGVICDMLWYRLYMSNDFVLFLYYFHIFHDSDNPRVAAVGLCIIIEII